METTDTFSKPSSLDEAEDFQRLLTMDIQSIQHQLGDKQRTDENGHRLSRKVYWDWRKKAIFVLNQKMAELRQVKSWIKQNRPFTAHTAYQLALDHLRNMVEILTELNDDSMLSTEAETKLETAEAFLNGGGA